MKKLELNLIDIVFGSVVTVLIIFCIFCLGYLVGRYEQIELNKSPLLKIPDINSCFKDK